MSSKDNLLTIKLWQRSSGL